MIARRPNVMGMTKIQNASDARNLFPNEIVLPSKDKLERLGKDDIVKMMFCDEESSFCAKIWVKIIERSGKFFTGYVQNDWKPHGMKINDTVDFKEDNVIDIWSGGFLKREDSWLGNANKQIL